MASNGLTTSRLQRHSTLYHPWEKSSEDQATAEVVQIVMYSGSSTIEDGIDPDMKRIGHAALFIDTDARVR
jgi:hypothetical protein